MLTADRVTDVEDIYRQALQLDASGRLALTEFLEFLLTKHRRPVSETIFPSTSFEDAATPSVYRGPALTLEAMREAIEWESGQHA